MGKKLNKKILVIGAGDYQVPLIKRIRELKYEVYCLDYNSEASGFSYSDGFAVIDVCDVDKCYAYAKNLGIDAVMTYGSTMTLPTVAYIAERLNLTALNGETAKLSKSKYAIKKRLADKGLNIKGEFFSSNTIDEAKQKKYSYPCVIKPSDGSGSKGVSIVHSQAELNMAIEYAFMSARYGEIYAESFIPGNEYSVECFVDKEDIYVYAIVKSTFVRNADKSISYGHRTPSGLSEGEIDVIEKEVTNAINALDINFGNVNFDVILSEDDKKPYIIDVGIRAGQNLIASHFVTLSRGVNMMDNLIYLALNEREKVNLKPNKKIPIATRLLIYNPGKIMEIKPMEELIGNNHIVDIVLRKNVGDILREYQDKSDTCGWVVADGVTPDDAEYNAQMAKDVIEKYIIIQNNEK